MHLRRIARAIILVASTLVATTGAMAQEPKQPLTTTATGTQTVIAAATAPVALAGLEPAILPVAPQPMLHRVLLKETHPGRNEIRTWKTLLVAEHSAAVFDAWSTRNALQSGNGYERNPLMKPFASSAAIYPMLQIAPAGLDFLSHRMMRSQNVVLRRTWWLPQTASIAGSVWCGSRNIHVANLQR